MHRDLKILGPVIIILFAGYLASFPLSLDKNSSNLITGADVYETKSEKCPADQVLFRISDRTNAHAETVDQGNYGYDVCYEGKVSSKDRACKGTSNLILKLSSDTNAHVEQKDQSNYNVNVCYGALNCVYKENSKCGKDYLCVASISSETNAHVGSCADYPIKICCREGKVDTDQDGIYDDGDGSGTAGDNLCHINRHKNFKTDCDDNCILTPNTDQKDTDGDGAGDVCDKFPNDGCSIVEQNDNCKNLQECAKGLGAEWKSTSVTEGEKVGLVIMGTEACKDSTFLFSVYDKDKTKSIVTVDPQPATFTGGKAESVWEAEYFTGGTNEYYFNAKTDEGVHISSRIDKLLKVSKTSSPECGNGKLERSNGEECDEGDDNGEAGVDCDKNCELIGPGGCTTDPACKGKVAGVLSAVCGSNKDKVRFCIKGPGGCLKLSDPKPCGKIGGVQKVCVPNAPACMSPTCKFKYTTSSCKNDQQTTTCTETSGLRHCKCPSSYPKITPCYEEPEGDFPFFSGFNVLVTLLMLAGFYVFRRH